MTEFLGKVAELSAVPLNIIQRIAQREMGASPGFEAFDTAVSRYLSIVQWVQGALNHELLDTDSLAALDGLVQTKPTWSPVLPPLVTGRSNSSSPIKTLGKYPVYAVLIEPVDQRHEGIEPLLVPLMAIFYLSWVFDIAAPSSLTTYSRSIRKFFKLSPSEKNRFITLSKHPRWDDQITALILMYRHYPELSWIRGVLKKLKIKIPKARRNNPIKKSKQTGSHSVRPSRFRPDHRVANIPQNIIWTGDDLDLAGLSDVESGAVDEQIVFDKGADVDPELAYRRFHAFSEMQNQYLRDAWRHLRSEEVAWLYEAVEMLIVERDVLGLVLALSMITARSINDVLNFKLSHQPFDQSYQYTGITLFPASGSWCHPKYQPENAYAVNEDERPFLAETRAFVVLNFPDAVRQWLHDFFVDLPVGQRLQDIVGDGDALMERARSWCKLARKTSGFSRLTLKRIRDWAMYEMLSTTQDPALVAQTFWFDTASSASVYYASFDSVQLQSAYSAVLAPFGETNAPIIKYNVGSELSVATGFMARLSHELALKLKKSMQTLKGVERLVAVHNDVVTYTLAMLLHQTGHRPVSDMFERADGLDEDSQIHFISDKVDGGGDHGRIVWLSPMAVEQLQVYKQHLQVLASYIDEYDLDLAQRIESVSNHSDAGRLPQFFYLSLKPGKPPVPQQITPARLKENLGLRLPLNTFRHHLATQLRRLHVPAEFIHYQLDHMKHAQEFDGMYSTLSVSDIRDALSPALNRLADEEGWTVQRGLSRARSRRVKARREQPQIYWTVGSEQRAARRRQEKKRINAHINACLNSVKSRQLDAGWLQDVEAELVKRLPQESDQRRAKRIIWRMNKNVHDGAAELFRTNWSIARPVKGAQSSVRLTHGGQLRRARIVRDELSRWVLQASGNQSPEELMAMFIASIVVNGRLVIEELVHVLRTQHNNCKRFEGLVWFDFQEPAFKPAATRRFFLDVMSIRLLDLMLWQRDDTYQLPRRRTLDMILKRQLRVSGLTELIELSIRLIAIELPAVVGHYATGNIRSASLETTTLLRVISGKRVVLADVEKVPGHQEKTYSLAYPLRSDSLNYETNRQLRKKIRDAFNSTGKLSNADRILVLRGLRTEFQSTVSPLCIAYVEWLAQLLEFGRKKDLKLSTTANYQANTSRCLFEACWQITDVSEFDEDAYIRLYEETLTYVEERNKPFVASLLGDFHQSLVGSWRAPHIDFSQIEPRCIGRSVRPNLITEGQFQKACARLDATHRFVLELLYRGRLRSKEYKNLSLTDIHVSENAVNVDIRSTANRTTKTIAGVRTVPFHRYISEQGREDLALFCQTHGKGRMRELIPDTCLDSIKKTLIAVTEPTVVLYDMRHSGVSLALLRRLEAPGYGIEAMVEPRIYSECSTCPRCQPQRAALYYEAMITGHASPSTTTSYYTHTLDWVLFSHSTARLLMPWGSKPARFFAIDDQHLNYVKRQNPDNYLYVIQKELVQASQISQPEEIRLLTEDEVPVAERDNPLDIFTIMEVIRGALLDEELSFTALRAGLDVEVVEHIRMTARELEAQSGYALTAYKNAQSWQQWSENPLLQSIQVNDDIEPLNFFIRQYDPNHGALFFDNESEFRAWMGYVRAIVGSEHLTILVSKKHPQYTRQSELDIFANSLGIRDAWILSKTVFARTQNYQPSSGLGLRVRGEDVARYSFNSLFCRGIFSKCVLQKVK